MLLGVVAHIVLQDAAGAIGVGDEMGIVERVFEVAAQDAPEGDVLAGRYRRSEELGAGRIGAGHARRSGSRTMPGDYYLAGQSLVGTRMASRNAARRRGRIF